MPLAPFALFLAFVAVAWAAIVDGPAGYMALVPAAIAVMMGIELLLTRRGLLVAMLAIGAVLLPGLAHAADPITVGTLFGDMREAIGAVLNVAASAIVGLLAWALLRWAGVKLDEGVRNALQSALENGIHAGLGAVQGAADRAHPAVLDNDVIQVALKYVRQFAPGAVKHFGLDDDKLAELLRAQLGRIVPTVPSP